MAWSSCFHFFISFWSDFYLGGDIARHGKGRFTRLCNFTTVDLKRGVLSLIA